MHAPNFLCAKLIYKILTYKFAGNRHPGAASAVHTRYTPPTRCPRTTLQTPPGPSNGGTGRRRSTCSSPPRKRPDLSRDDRAQLRSSLAEAWLLQDDVAKAAAALGAEPHARERLNPARVSDLWRLHGRIAVAGGEASRGIAFLARALTQAERAHDSRAIGLAHYELGISYRQIGDTAIVREHITKAASALHAAGDRRHLAMVHSLSGITQAQEGRLDEAMAALRQAERLAVMVEAGDVLATVCGNQANVALMQHRHEQALALAERSVELQEQAGTPHGIGVALASLGQICVRLGNLSRAEQALHRALDVRSPAQFRRETTGAVFDSLAQIYVIRGALTEASASLERARAAYGELRTAPVVSLVDPGARSPRGAAPQRGAPGAHARVAPWRVPPTFRSSTRCRGI